LRGVVALYRAGVVTGARKTLQPGKVVCTFGVGTKMQCETADRNPDFLCHAVDLTNPPHAMISVAHPDFRDDLEREARGHGLIPRGVF
jgi:acyl-CoA hydrolase